MARSALKPRADNDQAEEAEDQRSRAPVKLNDGVITTCIDGGRSAPLGRRALVGCAPPPDVGRRPPPSITSLPNLLSLSRLPLGGVFWVDARPDARRTRRLALGVMALAAGTDVLDGTIARRRGVATAGMGSWLDPICDKLFVGAVLAALHFERGVPLWLLAVIVARELIQLPMVVVYRAFPTLRHWLRYDFRASPLGKAATITQFLAIGSLVMGWPAALPLAWGAFGLGLVALGDYVRRAVAIGKQRLQRTRRGETTMTTTETPGPACLRARFCCRGMP